MIASRTRHCLSSASVVIAGSREDESFSMPITLLTCSSLEIMFNRTSGKSSFSICRKIGKRWLIVSFLPKMGANPLISDPRAARTCCEESVTSSSTLGMISFSKVSRSTSAQKPGICFAMALLTSASVSLRSLTKAGTRSRLITSSSTAFAIFSKRSATMYRTRQLRSSNRLRRAFRSTP